MKNIDTHERERDRKNRYIPQNEVPLWLFFNIAHFGIFIWLTDKVMCEIEMCVLRASERASEWAHSYDASMSYLVSAKQAVHSLFSYFALQFFVLPAKMPTC